MKKDPIAARRRADVARGQVRDTFGQVKKRLHPKRLSDDAIDRAKQKVRDVADNTLSTVRENPAKTAGIIAAIGMFLFRKPLANAIVRAIKEKKNG